MAVSTGSAGKQKKEKQKKENEDDEMKMKLGERRKVTNGKILLRPLFFVFYFNFLPFFLSIFLYFVHA